MKKSHIISLLLSIFGSPLVVISWNFQFARNYRRQRSGNGEKNSEIKMKSKRVYFNASNLPQNGDTTIHNHFMELALEQARFAAERGEVPIGAVVVRNCTKEKYKLLNQGPIIDASVEEDWNDSTRQNLQQSEWIRTFRGGLVEFEVLSASGNQVEANFDASAHAELLALREAAAVVGNWRLLDCTLYCTMEPCPICLSAAQAFRIDQLVYGTTDHRLGAVETYLQLLNTGPPHPFHNISTVISGIKQEACARVIKDFFRERRSQKKKRKEKGRHKNE